MAKTINMDIEVRNIILDFKRLGKTSGQLSKTLSELKAAMFSFVHCRRVPPLFLAAPPNGIMRV